MKDYDGKVDYKFLKAMGIDVVKYQPWQLGLFFPDLKGKFLWYPRKGTLMFEDGKHGEAGREFYKVGQRGEFPAGYMGDADSTERVYNEIMKKVNEQKS
mgnify:CR=1 FL=1